MHPPAATSLRNLLAALTAAAALAAAAAAQGPLPEHAFPSLPADAPAGTGATLSCLPEAPGEVLCGRYRVWEDREARSGRTIDLAFVVLRATAGAERQPDAVTFLNGGPGQPVAGAAAGAAMGAAALRRQRDVLLLDLRGTGYSAPLACDVPFPGGVASRFGALFPLDHAIACRDRLTQRARLDLYTSNQTMDDLDELRSWLGYPTLDLVGGSYGTREVQVFLRRHPGSVRTVVLYGIAPLFAPVYVTHAAGLQRALDELVAECAAQPACAAAYPRLGAVVRELFERVRRDPPVVRAEGEEVHFGPGDLGYAMRGLLYTRAAEVPALVYGAVAGEWQPLADYYLARTRWVGAATPAAPAAGMHFSVICAEDLARLDAATVARETAGTFLGDHLVRGYLDVCAVWPYARLPESFWEPVASPVPALLISGSRDPVTPPSAGEALARHLPNSVHVVVPGAGHVPAGPCVQELERQVIERGSVAGLDTSCVTSVPPTAFVLPAGSGSR